MRFFNLFTKFWSGNQKKPKDPTKYLELDSNTTYTVNFNDKTYDGGCYFATKKEMDEFIKNEIAKSKVKNWTFYKKLDTQDKGDK